SKRPTNCVPLPFPAYQAGVYSNGSYAFTSVVFDSHAADTLTAVQCTSQSASGGAYQHGDHAGANVVGLLGDYDYTSGSTAGSADCLAASGSSVLHEEGQYADGSYSF